jgi:hypothetical protein
MGERRRTARQKSFLRGRVEFDNGRSSFDCLIRDMSELGARIIFSDVVNLPNLFSFHVPQKGQSMRGQVIWRHGDEIGVAFPDANDIAPASTKPDHLTERVTALESEVGALRRLLKDLSERIANS